VARGNEKGRVERAIRYIRDAFFAARAFTDLDDLNAQAQVWTLGMASERRCLQEPALTVAQAFIQEREHLLALPDAPTPTDELRAVTAGKTPYVRFDLNDYSIPHTHARKSLTVAASPALVRILDGQTVLAAHVRSYDRGQQIEAPEHIEQLVQHKAQASAHRGVNRLTAAVPASAELLRQAAQRGEPLTRLTRTLQDWLDHYGADELDAAIGHALARGVPHPNAVRLALEQRRLTRNEPPAIAVALPEHIKQRDIPVRAHRLESYDQLMEPRHDNP
jgi:hypothetical protein